MDKMKLILVLLLACFHSTVSTEVEVCQPKDGAYRCKTLSRTELIDHNIPDESCHLSSCQNCFKTWKTVISYQDEIIIPTTFTVNLQPVRTGPHALIQCQHKGTPCVCSQDNMCTGNEEYCRAFTCRNHSAADCKCKLAPAEATVIHTHEGKEIRNPVLISYQICNVRKKLSSPPHNQRHRRHLLSNEEAIFQHENIKLSYTDPVITSTHPGLLIIRIRGYERIKTLTEHPYQTYIPSELLTESAEMKLIFVTSDGKSLKGAINIIGRRMCPALNCLICYESIKYLKCLPIAVTYTMYTMLILISAVTFLYVKTVLSAIWRLLYIVGYVAWKTYRILRGSTFIAVKSGAIMGAIVRNRAQQANEFLERRLNRPNIPAAATLAVLALILCVDGAAAECNAHTVISSKAKECADSGHEKTCRVTTNAQATLLNLGYQQCLWFTDEENDRNLFSLKLKFETVVCEWQTSTLYYTHVTAARYLSHLACANHAACGWGEWCIKDKRFPTLTKEAMEWPGILDCRPSDSGSTSCWILDSQHCIFFRIWLEADFMQAYEVKKITGMQCKYKLSVQHYSNDTTETLDVKNYATTSTGVNIQIVGSFDQPTEILNTNLISRVGDAKQSYFHVASLPGVPKRGYVGDTQAKEPITKEFIFDPKMFDCTFYESTMRCDRQQSYLTTLIETKENSLPMTTAWHYFKINSKGTLISEMLQSAPIIVNLQFSGYKFSLETQTVCPKFTDSEIKITGCYSCDPLAVMTLEAFSSCAPGQTDIRFETLMIHTRTVHLDTSKTSVKIHFKTSAKCLQEKLCLQGRTVSACRIVDFCLERAEIHLAHPNMSYAITRSSISSPWDMSHFFTGWTLTAMGITKMVTALITGAILLLFLISSIVTCCRGGRL